MQWKMRQRFNLICVLLLCVFSVTSCSSKTLPQPVLPVKTSSQVSELLGGDNILAILQSPDSVRGFLLPQKSYHQVSLADYEMRFGPVDLSASHQTELIETLVAEESYLFDVAKGCMPDYGVRIEFVSGGKTVDVLFCFGCSQLQIYADGKSLSGGLFDPAEKTLAAIMKQIFPDDAGIQSL